jgi:hypothetical protein
MHQRRDKALERAKVWIRAALANPEKLAVGRLVDD